MWDASRASSVVALSEYLILISFLILVISASVGLSTFEIPILSAFDSGSWISYLYVWDLTITLKYPGCDGPVPFSWTWSPAVFSISRYLSPNAADWSSCFV